MKGLAAMAGLGAWLMRSRSRLSVAPLRAAGQAGNVPAALRQVVRRDAQTRWLLPSVATITPHYLEAVLRGALTGDHVLQWELFDLMEDTWPRLVKNLNEVKQAAIGELLERWRVQAWSRKGEAPDSVAQERASLVEEALFEMTGDAAADENGFEQTLYDILDAWSKGTSVLEIEWEQRASGIMAPQATCWVDPRNYAWGPDGRLGLVLETQGTPTTAYRSTANRELEDLPEDKFLVCVRKARTGHPLCGPLLRPLAWWWCASNFAGDWLLNFAQIFGLPIRWANYQTGAVQQTIDAINDMLENLGSAGWASFPAGTTIELKEAGKGAEELPQSSILDRADKNCDLLVLGQTLTTDVRREGGSRALGEVHEHVRDDVVHSAARFCASVLNGQLVPALLRLNYGDLEQKPSFVPNEEEPEAAKANAEVLQLAVQMGVPVPVDFALEKLNIPKAEAGQEILRMQAANVGPAAGSPGGMPAGMGGNGPALQAADATDKLIENVLEDLTGVEARWLGGVKPFFRSLVVKAQDANMRDADFVQALEQARRRLPELFVKLDRRAVERALLSAMSTAVVNGASRGAMARRMA